MHNSITKSQEWVRVNELGEINQLKRKEEGKRKNKLKTP